MKGKINMLAEIYLFLTIPMIFWFSLVIFLIGLITCVLIIAFGELLGWEFTVWFYVRYPLYVVLGSLGIVLITGLILLGAMLMG
jgi:hypothetical protein